MEYYERHLPHWNPGDKPLFITWRLKDSLPKGLLDHLRAKYVKEPGRIFRYADRALDQAKIGPTWLKEPRIAAAVARSLRTGQELGHYKLHSYVVMSNHVHVLLSPERALGQITRSVKGSTARIANDILGRTGLPFWQDESFDRWVRNDAEFTKIRHYIEHNPVSAGLVTDPCDWVWSSATCRAGQARVPVLH